MFCILLAEGFEETEMIAPLDVLRRAEVPVKTVSIAERIVVGAHGIPITADLTLDELDPDAVDGILLPGGMPGTRNLQASEAVLSMLRRADQQGQPIAAICAAPMILGELGLLHGKKAVCFPGFEDSLHGALLQNAPVVQDQNIITARGAGAALPFGAAIVDFLHGKGSGDAILAAMQTPTYV